MKRIGLIVNPIAGLGGPAAMKGSDSPEGVRKALAMGIEPMSHHRAVEVLKKVKQRCPVPISFITAPGTMGEDAAVEAGFEPVVCGVRGKITTAADTKRIAVQILEMGVDLLVFAGGDGTARDIFSAIGPDVLSFGIPAGVKMHSGVFALHPEAAASLILAIAEELTILHKLEEVVDLDEDEYVKGNVAAKRYGCLTVPAVRNYLQGMKAGRPSSDEQAIREIGGQIASLIEETENYCYAIGAGTTTRAVKDMLGIKGTLLGVDVCRGKNCFIQDACGRDLERLAALGGMKIVVSPVGGQGYLFGRGNQQFTPKVIKFVEKKNIIVVCPPGKIAELRQRPFLVDTGDEELDNAMRGYIRVMIGWNKEIVCRIE